MYWPASVIYHDLEMKDRSWAEQLRAKYDLSGTLYQFHQPEGRDNYVNQYTCGMAIMYAPAFWIAHSIAEVKDGFSPPYQYAVAIWSLFIALAGLWALRALLKVFFHDTLTAVLLVIGVFATNYFVQIRHGLATPHNYLFLLYTLFLLAVLRWHKTPTARNAAWMAIPFGLMALTRPTELLAVLIPVLWGIRNKTDLKSRFRDLFGRYRTSLITFLIIAFCIGFPQLLYWKYAAGKWLFNSYSNPGEGFDFLSPHTANFLWSYRKGWLIYSPIVLMVIPGFVYLWQKHRGWFWPLLVFFALNLYVVSSWSNWWYAQCFSQRAMVHTLPITLLLVGFGIKWSLEHTLRTQILIPFATLACVAGIFFSWQYEHYILDQWRMTGNYFWSVFLQTEVVTDEQKDLLLVPREFSGEMVMQHPELYTPTQEVRYSTLQSEKLRDTLGIATDTLYGIERLSKEHEFSAAIKKHYRDWTKKDHIWVKGKAIVFIPEGNSAGDVLLVATADHKGPYGYKTYQVADSAFTPNAWNTIDMLYLSPEVRTGKDDLSFYVWYRGKSSVALKEIELTVLERP